MGPLLDLVDRVLDVLGGLDPLLLALATAALTALETTALVGLVIPGDAAVLLAGSTVDSPARFGMVLAAAAIGTYTGELGGYAIGRAAGPRLRASRFGRLLGEHRWAAAEAYLAGRGAKVLIPVRFVSVAHAIAPLLCGTVRMPLRRFALWTAIGAVLWAAAYTTVGTIAGAAYREYRELGLLTTLAVVLISVVVALARRLRRRRRAQAADRSTRDPARVG
ncbi:MAG TPA: VTT domain-containing protein [Natronosporangium sp.]